MTINNFWLFLDGEPGTLRYALDVQKEIGGVIKFDGKKYWIDFEEKENPDE